MTEATETIEISKQNARDRTLLVEFKAPRELVEALRSLMRAFLEGEKK